MAGSDDRQTDNDRGSSGGSGSAGDGPDRSRDGGHGHSARNDSSDARSRRRQPSHAISLDIDWQSMQPCLGLSSRELEVARHIFHGEGEARIAYLLGISANTVHTYIKRTYAKLGVSSQRELIMRMLQEHIGNGPDGR